ncbi:porin family protein, partial [Vibrio sp. 1727]|nr:porin family protein [Vibrio sp. 1727]
MLVVCTFCHRSCRANQTHCGANLGYGDVSYDVNNGHDDGDMFLGDVYYRYMFDQNFGLEAGY